MAADGAHQLPTPTQPLPELNRDERRLAVRLMRMVKAGELWSYGVRRHEKREQLEVEWADDGGARLAT